MPGGRRTTPLFDLLAKRQPTATPAAPPRPVVEARASKPVVRVELKPREVVPPSEREPERPVGGARFSTNTIYLAIAIGAVLLLGAIELGVFLGKRDTEKKLEGFVRRPAPSITETGAEPAPAYNPNGTPKSDFKAVPDRQPAPEASGDPREQGLNYLYLATLPEADTLKALAFLKDNGMQAFAVQVDTKGSSANNAARYRVGVLPGIPSGELKKTVAQNLVAKVLELGDKFQKEHRGSSNFAKYQWEKFQ